MLNTNTHNLYVSMKYSLNLCLSNLFYPFDAGTHVHLPGYTNETAELLLPHKNWFSVCDASCGQVFTVGICITKACEVVGCAEMYAARGC